MEKTEKEKQREFAKHMLEKLSPQPQIREVLKVNKKEKKK